MNNFDRPFGIYEKALMPQDSWNKLFYNVSQAGYECFEISLDESDARLQRLTWSQRQMQEVASAARTNGVRLMTACFSGHRRFPLGSADPATVSRAMTMMRQGISFCGEIGIRVLQIAGYDVYYEPRTTDTGKRYCENLAISAETAAKAGVMLAIEPVELFLTSVKDTMEVVNSIQSPWLQIYPDIANLKSLGFDPLEELPLAKGHMVALHVRDSLPDFFYNVPFGRGTMDFEGVFRLLDNMNYHGPLIVEMWNEKNPQYKSIIRVAREFMQEKIEAVRK